MEKKRFLFAVLFLGCLLSASLLFADPYWRSDLVRHKDFTGQLNEKELKSLEKRSVELLKSCKADFVSVIVNAETLGNMTNSSFARKWYRDGNFGYGEDRSGVIALYNDDTKEMLMVSFGQASQVLNSEYLQVIIKYSLGYKEKYRTWGILFSCCGFVKNAIEKDAEKKLRQMNNRVGEGKELPEWYPADLEKFKYYSDAKAPRVVDNAEVFSKEIISSLGERIAEMTKEHGIDIVIVTEKNVYNLYHREYAEAFYDYNGYGIGPGREGICLLICMDPEHPGWASCIRGPSLSEFITPSERIALEDTFRDDYRSNDLTTAIFNWIDKLELEFNEVKNVQSLVAKPLEITIERKGGDRTSTKPPWYPANVDLYNFPYYNDANAPRILDKAHIIPDPEEEKMLARIAEITKNTGMDIVIYTDKSAYYMPHSTFAADFYDYNGYGIGPEREGLCMMVCMDPNDRGWYVCATGSKTRGKYTYTIANTLDDDLFPYMKEGRYAEGLAAWLENVYMVYGNGGKAEIDRVGEDEDVPGWFPKNWKSGFVICPENPYAPRVVDKASVLSTEEMERLNERVNEVRRETGTDIVIFTDSNLFGFSLPKYAAKFFDYNGYGFGDGREGICLMLYKTDDEIQWRIHVSGQETKQRYIPYGDMLSLEKDQKYVDSMLAWLDGVRNVIEKGVTTPDTWMPDRTELAKWSYNGAAPRVVDESGSLSEDEKQALEERLAKMSAEYGFSVSLCVTDMPMWANNEFIGNVCYDRYGYGIGEGKDDGMMMTICPAETNACKLVARGAALKRLSKVNLKRIEAQSNSELYVIDAVNTWLDNLAHMQKTGRVNRTMISWGCYAVIAFICGLIGASISLHRADDSMIVIRYGFLAGLYVVRDSIKITRISDKLVNTTTVRKYIPPPPPSSSSSSSSSHSYSSSYRGSSSSSHSGSGRRF